ncbi:MAG TPA: hypothetical protein VE404_02625 [Verrucomicrobiae bacterium]|nr:hypothetical protein [Verrucomicrobiae bacterium]
MNVPACDLEDAVLRAAKLGRFTGELREHARTCALCADVALAASFMSSESAATAEHPLPDGALVYWKSQLRAKREAAARATRPILLVEQAAWACAIVVAGAVAMWAIPALTASSEAVVSARAAATSQGSGLGVGTLLALALLPIALTITVIQTAKTGN